MIHCQARCGVCEEEAGKGCQGVIQGAEQVNLLGGAMRQWYGREPCPRRRWCRAVIRVWRLASDLSRRQSAYNEAKGLIKAFKSKGSVKYGPSSTASVLYPLPCPAFAHRTPALADVCFCLSVLR